MTLRLLPCDILTKMHLPPSDDTHRQVRAVLAYLIH